MLLRLLIFLFVLASLSSCNGCKEHKDKPGEPLQKLLTDAENSAVPLNEKLHMALMADSIAIKRNDAVGHLYSMKMIATLYLVQRQYDSSKTYSYKTAELAAQLRDYEILGRALNNLGYIFNEQQYFDSAATYYLKAMEIFRTHHYPEPLAASYINLGIVRKNEGHFEEAFRVTDSGARILHEQGSILPLASAYTNMGNILRELGRLDEALNHHLEALRLQKQENDSVGIAGSLHNIGNVYRIKSEYPMALAYFDSALVLKRQLNQVKSEATTLDNIGEVRFNLQQYDTSENYFKQALSIRTKYNDTDGILTTLNKLTWLFIAEGKLIKAEQTALLADSLAPQSKYLKQRLNTAVALSDIYVRLNRSEPAAYYATHALDLKDSLYKVSIADTVFLLNEKAKTQQTEKKLLLSKQQQKIQRISIIALGVLVIISSLFAYFVKKAKQKVELLFNELNHRVKNNLQIVSSMLYFQLDATDDAAQQALIQSSINRVDSMNIIHKLLHKKTYEKTIDMASFVKTLVDNLTNTFSSRSGLFNVSVIVVPVNIDVDKAIPAGLIINEVITNIFKYARPAINAPIVEVKLARDNGLCKLEIRDNCEPWDSQIIMEKKKGLGLFIIKTLVKQLDGNWQCRSGDNGTVQSLEFAI